MGSGDLRVQAGNIRVTDTEATLTLESTSSGQSFEWKSSASGELVLSKDDGTGLAEVFTFSRYLGPSGWVSEIRGPTATGALPDEVALVADSVLTLQATDTVSMQQTAEDAGLNLYADSGPRAFLFAGDPASTNPGIITLGVNDVGRLRFGRFRAGVPTPDDRLVVEASGLLLIYPDVSTGSPGTNAVLTMDAVTAPTEAVLTIGPAISGSGIRGQVVAGWDGVGSPGLIVLEADDGTPVYLSLWDIGSGKYSLRGSLTVPTSSSDGEPIIVSIPP